MKSQRRHYGKYTQILSIRGSEELTLKICSEVVSIKNKDYLKFEIPSNSIKFISIYLKKAFKATCTMKYCFIPMEEIVIKEGVSTEDL